LTSNIRQVNNNSKGDKTVVFVEAFWHHDLLSTIYEISKNFKEWKPIIISTDRIIQKAGLKSDNTKIIKIKDSYRHEWASLDFKRKLIYYPKLISSLKKEGEDLLKILKKIKFDVLVINTLCEPAFFFPIFQWIKKERQNIRLVAVIHNSYLWEVSWFLKMLNTKDIRERRIGWLLFNITHKEYIDGIITLGGYVKLPKNFYNIPKIVIPSRLPAKKPLICDKEDYKIYFVIPGKVQQAYGKNYIGLLEAFKDILEKNPKYKDFVKIVLLGKLLDTNIREFIIRYLKESVIYYDHFVKEEEYLRWMSKAHFVIIPITSSEPYGKYKISGALNDAFAYGVPVLLPENYASDYQFDRNVIRFSWSNLERSIEQFIEMVLNKSENYIKIKKTAEIFKKSMEASYVASQFEKFLDEVYLKS